MTFKGEQRTPLPAYILLTNPRPGEAQQMTKRSYPAALRFHKIKNSESIRYMLNEVMLYRPLHDEVNLDDVEALFLEKYNGRSKLEIVKKSYFDQHYDFLVVQVCQIFC